MKKIINGKLYDTDSAKIMAYYKSDYSVNDFHFYEETLYKKKTGEFFIFGEGNGLSNYAESVDINLSRTGKKIIPLSEGEAKKWAEERLSVDAYVDIFGEVEE